MNRWKCGAAALGFLGMALYSPAAFAAEYIDIELNGSFLFEGSMAISNIAIANPDVADIVRPSGFDSEVLIVGNAPGATTLFVWYEDGSVEQYTVNVGIDDKGQALAIQRAIGLPRVRVQVVPGKEGGSRRVLLKGTVRNQMEHMMAVKIASLYTGDTMKEDSKAANSESATSDMTSDSDFEYDFDYRTNRVYNNVIDLLTIENPSQVRLEAQLVEISDDGAKNLGLKYGGGVSFMTDDDAVGSFYGGESFANSHDSRFWLWNHFSPINATLNLLIKEGKAKVLSRPSVSTMSGAKAKIFIGGQLPYPVPDGNGGETLEWKDYGIRLNIRPVVEENGTITAEVHAGVSRLDYSNSVMTSSTSVPAITAREAHSIVHLNNGSTMVVGGLLNSEEIKTVSKIPLLSAIPILGEFFKHTESSTDKRELIILITPVLVDENTPARMSDKMQEMYDKGREEVKAQNKVDLNEDKKAEEAERAKKEQESNAREPKERIQVDGASPVRMGNAWNRIYKPDAEAVVLEAATAGEEGN
ncbi:MAG: pilus assembly protein N-terminal domain-containing protein [Schwartzia sp.]|nr:pilus assembly protein N-terminal domain-containing protein [Schwartzia sp. (in: firmicutes)]